VWLKAAGYRTGIYGKYINSYAPYAPYQAPGWDEWHVFVNPAYFNYTLVENGVENSFGSADTDYSTDVLRDKAVQFIHDSAGGPPFFLYFAPKAPHAPATPAPRHAGSFSAIPPWRPPNYNEADGQAGVGAGDLRRGGRTSRRTPTISTGGSSSACRRWTRRSRR
jgi:N-acetylglucosamine-6-sulfatase